MQKWYQMFPRNRWPQPLRMASLHYSSRSTSSSGFPTTAHITFGILMTAVFFLCYRLTYARRGWRLNTGTAIQMLLSVLMTIFFHYPYFGFFLAFFIGNTV